MLSAGAQGNAAWIDHVTSWATAAAAEDMANELEAFALSPVLDVTAIRAPILARAGELDAALPFTASQELKGLAPDVTVQIVPGVGHALLLEDFAATAAAIEAHLARAS
jgi:pimeloyl-ACP methyl ester carboxylesterase